MCILYFGGTVYGPDSAVIVLLSSWVRSKQQTVHIDSHVSRV